MSTLLTNTWFPIPIEVSAELKAKGTIIDLVGKWWDCKTDAFKFKRITNCRWDYDGRCWRSADNNNELTGVRVTHFMLVSMPADAE